MLFLPLHIVANHPFCWLTSSVLARPLRQPVDGCQILHQLVALVDLPYNPLTFNMYSYPTVANWCTISQPSDVWSISRIFCDLKPRGLSQQRIPRSFPLIVTFRIIAWLEFRAYKSPTYPNNLACNLKTSHDMYPMIIFLFNSKCHKFGETIRQFWYGFAWKQGTKWSKGLSFPIFQRPCRGEYPRNRLWYNAIHPMVSR